MDLPCTHLPFLQAYLFSRQAAVPAPGAECSFPLSGEISSPYRQPARESPSFLCPIININHNLADEKKFPAFVISCQSSPSFFSVWENKCASQHVPRVDKTGLLQTKKKNSEHEVLLGPSGGALGVPCSALGQDNLCPLPHCWGDTDLGGDDGLESSSLSPWAPRAGHSITAPGSACREGRACPHPLAHSWHQSG